MSEHKQNCAELTAKMLSEMRADNYSYSTTERKIIYIYRSLVDFCGKNFEGFYSYEAGRAFLCLNESRNLCPSHANNYRNSITRLDHALRGDFHWKPVSKEKKPYESSCFDAVISEYESHLIHTGKTEPDVRNRIHVLARFLAYAESKGATDLDSMTADIIYGGFETEGSKDEFCKSVKSFLGYSFRNGLAKRDLRCLVPSCPRHNPVPTMYTLDETGRILDSIDRSTRTGKRNYCITLIAARLGLRSCDIAGLEFGNIDREGRIIKLVQKKTGELLELPLLPDVDEAIDDYAENARPDTDVSKIFVSVPHPNVTALRPHTIYTIVSRIIDRSGLDIKGRKRGAHALRSSLASQLLEEGRTYSEIGTVLGHTSPDSAKSYVRVQIEKLRGCALAVPEFQNASLNRFFRKGGGGR